MKAPDRRRRIGILDHESLRLGGSQHVVARMAACLAAQHDVEIIHGGRGYTVSDLGSTFDLDLGGVGERVDELAEASFSVPAARSTRSRFASGFRRERALTRPYDLFIYSGHRTPPLCGVGRGIVYCHFPFDARPSVRLEDDARWTGRSPASRWLRMRLYEGVWRRRMRGYPLLLANSRFSARWIERLWRRRADVVYPPVPGDGNGAGKRNLIVSVGRFIATDRKNLRAQLEALPEFLRRVDDGWTLCMVGFCGEREEDRRFLEGLRQAAADLPVCFVVDADREKVSGLLREAKLFWHTAGLSHDGEEIQPRHREHFGMATVEAMRAGCVPVVPDGGGQPEIVSHGESGFLCGGPEDLVRFSAAVAGDETLRERIARRAAQRSHDFAPRVFEDRMRSLVSGALAAADGLPAAQGNVP